MIKVRRLPFEFTDDIPFWFNPKCREASMLVNGLSFLAPAFERYFIKAIRDAMPRIKSDAVREEARLFCLQEGQHSKIHTDHQNLLLRKYPELEAVRDEVNRSYDDLYRNESTEFALAHATARELGFKPLARYLVDNRQVLFGDGDPRITAFVLWHFVEEFEHRNTMFDVYQDIVGDYTYRLKVGHRSNAHVKELNARVMKACRSAEQLPPKNPDLPRIPRLQKVRLILGLLETNSPFHNPQRGNTPKWITDWFTADELGHDMTAVAL